MQGTWARRIKETFAIVTIGDGAIELVSPREHSLLWGVGPEGARKVARFFAEHPNYVRLIGAAQIALRPLARAAPVSRGVAAALRR